MFGWPRMSPPPSLRSAGSGCQDSPQTAGQTKLTSQRLSSMTKPHTGCSASTLQTGWHQVLVGHRQPTTANAPVLTPIASARLFDAGHISFVQLILLLKRGEHTHCAKKLQNVCRLRCLQWFICKYIYNDSYQQTLQPFY